MNLRRFGGSQKILQTRKLHFWIIHENFSPHSPSFSHSPPPRIEWGIFLFFLHDIFFLYMWKIESMRKNQWETFAAYVKIHCPRKKMRSYLSRRSVRISCSFYNPLSSYNCESNPGIILITFVKNYNRLNSDDQKVEKKN